MKIPTMHRVMWTLEENAKRYGERKMRTGVFESLERTADILSAMEGQKYHAQFVIYPAIRDADTTYFRKETVTAPNGVFPNGDTFMFFDEGAALRVRLNNLFTPTSIEFWPSMTELVEEQGEDAILALTDGMELLRDNTNHPRHFDVTSGRMAVSDPCYEPGTWCAGYIDDVMNGQWEASAEFMTHEQTGWGERLSRLWVLHDSVPNLSALGEDETLTSLDSGIDVGVDSGQAGFYDAEFFDTTPKGKNSEEGGFYNEVCDSTHDRHFDNPIFTALRDRCVVCSSGYGDGSYTCTVWRDTDGKAVAACITFIDDSEVDEDEDEQEAA